MQPPLGAPVPVRRRGRGRHLPLRRPYSESRRVTFSENLVPSRRTVNRRPRPCVVGGTPRSRAAVRGRRRCAPWQEFGKYSVETMGIECVRSPRRPPNFHVRMPVSSDQYCLAQFCHAGGRGFESRRSRSRKPRKRGLFRSSKVAGVPESHDLASQLASPDTENSPPGDVHRSHSLAMSPPHVA